jgi:hypothetical protein
MADASCEGLRAELSPSAATSFSSIFASGDGLGAELAGRLHPVGCCSFRSGLCAYSSSACGPSRALHPGATPYPRRSPPFFPVTTAGIRGGGGRGGAVEEDDEDNAIVHGEEKELAGANYRKRCTMCCTKLLEAGHFCLRPPSVSFAQIR